METGMLWLTSGLLLLLHYAEGLPRNDKSFIAAECYGNVLSLSCSPGHRIKVLDDFFGVSTNGKCRYEPGHCTVTNNRFSSVIHRYCEGKQTCTSFQVDRRHCGVNQTNYEQVEYECVPDTGITSICNEASYQATEGYLATPNFPNEYPGNKDCTCELKTTQKDIRIRLEATHFIVKFDNPCKDWLEISMAGRTRRLCGAYRSTLKSYGFNLTFHSDGSQGHQGVWMYFAVQPWSSNATISVDCRPLEVTTTTAPTTTVTTTEKPSSTTEELLIFVDPPPDYKDYGDLYDTDITTESSEKISTSTELITTTTPKIEHKKKGKIKRKRKKKKPVKDKAEENEVEEEKEFKDNTSRKSTSTLPPKDSQISTPAMVTTTVDAANGTQASPARGTTQLAIQKSSDAKEHKKNAAKNVAGDKLVATVPPKKENKRKDIEIKKRQNSRTTGIIIISICVGGIVLLIIILAILLCVNKRRRPKRQAEKERKKRLQQRLNSLSFYDSIPLYDSIGRKTGNTLIRLPPPPTTDSGHRANTLPRDSRHKPLDPKQLHWVNKTETTRPYWTPTPDLESDRDSAIYAELDKQSRGGATSEDLSRDLSLGDVALRNTPNGEGPPGYSLHLNAADTEDIYTHV